MTITKILAASFLMSVPALAQTNGTFLLTSSNTVSPSSPTTTIEIWATWSGPTGAYGFGVGNYDLTAADGLFSNAANVFNGPGSLTGIISGNVITGAVNGQVRIPGHPVWTGNPVLLATYDWTSTNFTPRTVPLDTSNTTDFSLILVNAGGTVQLHPNDFTPGLGFINVVPTPTSGFVLGLALYTATRRRRA